MKSGTILSPFNVSFSRPSTNTGALGSSKVPGSEMPRLACLDSPGPFTTHPITATFISSTPAYCSFQMPIWKEQYAGVEEMKVAVMGCVVNGPGESKHANLGISLPGTFEEPKAPVFVDGRLKLTLKGDKIVPEFIKILDDYVESHYGTKTPAEVAAKA